MRLDSPSDTSLLVARSILLASKDRDLARLVAPEEAAMLERILAGAGPAPWFDFVLGNGWARRVVFGVERAMVAGIIAHYLARKRWIEIQVREALVRGIPQVIVLGAGFDTLAARLAPEFPHAIFLELDHPATQAVKRKMPGFAPNLRFFPVDLTIQSLPADACPDFSKSRPSVIIAEGLTMYLTYHRWATRCQIERAYPQFAEFLTLKEQHDRDGLFQSEWWRHQRNLFAGT